MRVALWVVTAVLATVVLVVMSRDLLPPRTLTFAAGPEGGGYEALAQRYRQILARDDVTVELVTTAGSVENVDLLSEGAVDVALVQGGVEPDGLAETLGSMFLEPMFVFVRPDAEVPPNPARWSGLRIAAGGAGSGARAALRDLARASGFEIPDNEVVPLTGGDAADALLAGEVDLALFVTPVSAPYLERLVLSPDAWILRLAHVEALSRRLAESTLITLPSGAFVMDPPNPERDVRMIALAAQLMAQPELHPALVDRLVLAARTIHGQRDAVSGDDEFPTTSLTSLRVDPYAAGLIDAGPNRLHRVFPFWMVAQITRFALLLVPVLFVLVPLLRALPGLYVWRMRRRVFRHYSTIRAIDAEATQTQDAGHLDALSTQLEEIDREIADLKLPPAYREFAYTARLHVDLVRKRIAERVAA